MLRKEGMAMPEGTKKSVYSVCVMCTVRCPIEVEVENGAIKHIWGNPHILGGRFLCPRGAAGKVFESDDERLQQPMIRDGKRGGFSRLQQSQAQDPVFQAHQSDPRLVRESPAGDQKPCGFDSAGVEPTLTTKEVRNDRHNTAAQ